MKLNAKLERIDIKDQSDFRANYITNREDIESGQVFEEERRDKGDLNEYHRQIYPWIQRWSEKWKKYFFFNPKTKKSVWELPASIGLRAETYFDKKITRERE